MLRRGLIALSLAAPLVAHAAASVGQPAPQVTLGDASGKPVKLSDYRGKYVVLERPTAALLDGDGAV